MLYELNVRQFTPEGTFAAARERLPFLRSLGIDAIWLMPIYPIGVEGRKGTLGSYYSIRDYKGINEEFGSEADLRDFITAAHSLGMRVLLDWVANHTARDARWLDDKPYDWYEREADGTAKVPWDWTDTAKLNYSNHDVGRGLIEAMRYWVEQFKVDGSAAIWLCWCLLSSGRRPLRSFTASSVISLCLPKQRRITSSIVPLI